MANFLKSAVLAALLALVSTVVVRDSTAPIADSWDAAVRDSILIDLFNDPSIQHCLETLANECPAACCDPWIQSTYYCTSIHCPH